MANSADPDRLPTDLDLHCLQGRVYPGSAGQVNWQKIYQMYPVSFKNIHLFHFSTQLQSILSASYLQKSQSGMSVKRRQKILTLLSVFGSGTPIEPYFQPVRGVVCVAGLASDIPYPKTQKDECCMKTLHSWSRVGTICIKYCSTKYNYYPYFPGPIIPCYTNPKLWTIFGYIKMCLFVSVEVLRPCQPICVTSSTVS